MGSKRLAQQWAGLVLLLAGLAVAIRAQEPAGGPPPSGEGPDGPPPAGGPPPGAGDQNGPPRPPPGGRRDYKLKGSYTLNGGAAKTEKARTFTSDKEDVSAIFVTGGGHLTATDATITTGGGTSSQENSSFYGLNAAVLAAKGGQIELTGGSITTSGTGANGAFATGQGSKVTLTKMKIVATAGGGHGVMASGGGALTLVDVDMTTSGEHGAAVATDRGGGTVLVTGGEILTAGAGSPGIYSTGNIQVTGGHYRATGSEAAVIEGANSISLHDTALAGEKLCGVMIYQSFSGDAEGRRGVFTMEGGELSAGSGPLFFVTNTTAVITLNRVKSLASSGVLLKASSGRWGRKGTNGGVALLTATAQTMAGDVTVDDVSSASLTLGEHSKLTGKIHNAALVLDGTSVWEVTGDSKLTTLAIAGDLDGATVHNVVGNGHTVTYDASADGNAWLKGKRYKLSGGGVLIPREA